MKNELFSIGPITIYGYGLMIAIGVLAAYFSATYRSKKYALDPDKVFYVTVWAVIGGFGGAKLLYLITQLPAILKDPSLLKDARNGFVVDDSGMSEETIQELRQLISNKNYFGVEELLENQRLSKEQVEALTALPQLFGGPEVLKKAESLTGNPKALAAIRRLRELYQVAACYGCEEYISFDLGMLSKYQYYTGIIFQGFTYGTGEPLVTGGRYNKLLEHFGRPAPAIGFCLVMEQVLNALNRQNIQVPVMEGKRLVLYNERNREAAIQIAGMQRTHGMQIQCMRMEEGLKAEDYIVYGKSHQFTDIVSPVGEDQIQVINLFTDEVQMTNQKSFQ